MIKIVEKSDYGKFVTPHYELKYKYMIGDADGNFDEEIDVALDNPFLERYCKLLNSLKPLNGTWGIIFDNTYLDEAFEEGQITEEDRMFLDAVVWEDENKWYDSLTKEEQDQLGSLSDFGIRNDTNHSFVVFLGVELYYIDAAGVKYATIFE